MRVSKRSSVYRYNSHCYGVCYLSKGVKEKCWNLEATEQVEDATLPPCCARALEKAIQTPMTIFVRRLETGREQLNQNCTSASLQTSSAHATCDVCDNNEV